MKKIYLFLSIVGAVVPYFFFFDFIQLNGFDLIGFCRALFVNGAAGGFSADILVSSLVFWIFIFKENKVDRKWLFILLNLGIGLSCALPFYFYKREESHRTEVEP